MKHWALKATLIAPRFLLTAVVVIALLAEAPFLDGDEETILLVFFYVFWEELTPQC